MIFVQDEAAFGEKCKINMQSASDIFGFHTPCELIADVCHSHLLCFFKIILSSVPKHIEYLTNLMD
jgi:hypothetical protein